MKRIICKVHDSQKIVTKVGVEGEGTSPLPIEVVWDRIKNNDEEFYTLKDGARAPVKARKTDQGTKYLTTRPDNTIVNNLDELDSC